MNYENMWQRIKWKLLADKRAPEPEIKSPEWREWYDRKTLATVMLDEMIEMEVEAYD